MHLDALLADQSLAGGLEPRLGDAHLRMLSVIGFPTTTYPGILDELNRLAFPYRWSTRAILIDKTDAVRLLTKIRRQWFAKRKSIAAMLKEVMTNEASILVDTDAANDPPRVTVKQTDDDLFQVDVDDRDGDRVTCTATQPFSGTVKDLGNGLFRYTPNTRAADGFVDHFAICADDGHGGVVTTTVAVTAMRR